MLHETLLIKPVQYDCRMPWRGRVVLSNARDCAQTPALLPCCVVGCVTCQAEEETIEHFNAVGPAHEKSRCDRRTDKRYSKRRRDM